LYDRYYRFNVLKESNRMEVAEPTQLFLQSQEVMQACADNIARREC